LAAFRETFRDINGKKSAIIFFFLFTFWFLLVGASSYTIKNGIAYYSKFSGDSVTLQWIAPTINSTHSAATSYKIVMYKVSENNFSTILATYNIGTTTALTYPVTIPKAGVYIFKVIAVNVIGDGGYAVSNNSTYSTVDGNSMGWAVKAKLAPPISVIIGQ
jgi:hypothetical protein